MKSPKLLLLSCLLVICSITSCKKKNTSDPLGNSVILYINYANTSGNSTHYHIVYYSNNNNADSIINTGGGTDTGSNGYLALNYLNSSFIITDQSSNKMLVDINTNGMIDTIFRSADLTYILYNENQVGAVNYKISMAAYPYYTINTTNYTYTNGDITSVTKAGSVVTYNYDMSHNGQLGDPLRIDQFLSYGRPYTLSAHLVTDMALNGTLQEKYYYQFDGSGRITLLTKVINAAGSANDTERYAYAYNY